MRWLAREFGPASQVPLSNDDAAVLARSLTVHQLDSGTRILTAGEPADALYVVESGQIAIYSRLGGRERLLGLQASGGVIGDVTLLPATASPISAIARTPVTILGLPASVIRPLVEASPAFALRLLGALAQQLLTEQRRINTLTAGDLRDRLLTLLTNGNGVAGSPAILRMSQAGIATLLGASRQSVNKVLGQLAREGLVQHRYGTIELVDPVTQTATAVA